MSFGCDMYYLFKAVLWREGLSQNALKSGGRSGVWVWDSETFLQYFQSNMEKVLSIYSVLMILAPHPARHNLKRWLSSSFVQANWIDRRCLRYAAETDTEQTQEMLDWIDFRPQPARPPGRNDRFGYKEGSVHWIHRKFCDGELNPGPIYKRCVSQLVSPAAKCSDSQVFLAWVINKVLFEY